MNLCAGKAVDNQAGRVDHGSVGRVVGAWGSCWRVG